MLRLLKPPHFSWVIPHPTKDYSFFDFPQISRFGHTFEAAPVFLLFGKHWDRHKGFGVLHILAGHWREIGLQDHAVNSTSVAAVAHFVAGICAKGAKISCEFSDLRGNHKPLIIKGMKGTVVLELKRCNVANDAYYSVVTAIATTKAKGSVVGALWLLDSTVGTSLSPKSSGTGFRHHCHDTPDGAVPN
jgi:hypothetical protein